MRFAERAFDHPDMVELIDPDVLAQSIDRFRRRFHRDDATMPRNAFCGVERDLADVGADVENGRSG